MKFNQDFSLFAVFEVGLKLYNIDPFGLLINLNEDVNIVELLYGSPLMAIATLHCVKILNYRKNKILCEINFEQKVMQVLMNRKRLCVRLGNELWLYDMNICLLHTIPTTGIFAISENLLALTNNGCVILFDPILLNQVGEFQVHRNIIQSILFSTSGNILATASTGTLIKVHSLNGECLFEFHRGRQPAILQFALTDEMLAVCGTSTVHLFLLRQNISWFRARHHSYAQVEGKAVGLKNNKLLVLVENHLECYSICEGQLSLIERHEFK